ncbi:MAG: hypothetical protein JJT94_00290 [Bernardetiaceae bacterium]|nr:hypothetical protein [Bernardetiaceae bacterium]
MLSFFFRIVQVVIFAMVLLFLPSSFAMAQLAQSPYSRIGVGLNAQSMSLPNFAMGGLGISNPNSKHLNSQNPALLRFNSLTTFEAAITSEYKNLEGQDAQFTDFSGNLASVAFAFPVSPKWTIGLGFQAATVISYANIETAYLPRTQVFTRFENQGEGGISQLYFNTGAKIWKELSVGVRANYNFGFLRDRTQSILDDGQNEFIIELLDRRNVSDFSFEGGLHYRFKPAGKASHSFINLGVTYALGTSLKTTEFRAFQRKLFDEALLESDTLFSNNAGSIQIPSSWRLGISLQRPIEEVARTQKRSAYTIGIDVSLENWAEYSDSKIPNDSLQQAVTIAFGGELIPNVRATSILSRTTYRAGLRYERSAIMLRGQHIDNLSLHAGITLPARSSFSGLNIAAAVGQRGTLENGLVRERYVRISLGLTILDRWFVRRRYE